MIIFFLINAPQSTLKIINLFFNIFIKISVFNTKEEILSSEMIIYENNIIKKSLINLVKEFPIL